MAPLDCRTLAGRTLGRYRIGRLIGQGGTGVVYRARDRVARRTVALKVLGEQPGRGASDEFRREALWLSQCASPHIVSLYDAGHTAGVDYLSMELMETTLYSRLSASRPHAHEVIFVGAGILNGLAAVHRAGIIHRDVKPANVGIAADGTIKLLDFGIASPLPWSELVQECDTAIGLSSMAGTLDYMSPEQLCGDRMDERVDIYGAGAVLYELATGRLPFQANRRLCLINAILNAQALPPSAHPGVSPELDGVILRALAKSPADRFESAGAMLHALLQLPAAAAIFRNDAPQTALWLTGVAV
jgi:serine/threonine protein kinase